MLQLVKKIDFRFLANTTNIAVGNSVETGQAAAYDVYDGERWTNQYQLDEISIAEIAGIELIGPVSQGGQRDPLEYVRIRIDGEEYKHVNLNEKMAPAFNFAEPNRSPFFGGQVKVGDQYESLPHSFCHNIGVPMLLGGSPMEAVPKVGPGQKISVEVRTPRAAEGGAAITNDFTVRLSVVQCRSNEMFKKLGEHYGWLSGNSVGQSFTFMDLEENGDVAEYSVSKTVDMTEDGQFTMDNWTELYGGLDAKKPYIYPYIRYAKNATATTTNEEYVFTKIGSNVLHDEQELDWNFDKREALKLQHIGVDAHANHRYTRVYIQGRDSNPYGRTPPTGENEYPMPLQTAAAVNHYNGPASLGRGAIIWNTKGNVGIKDSGTAIPAWGTAPAIGTTVAVWGKSYKFF
uniref:Uncharacterized protein n=1 Tax=viral metagenome TaxID=1070528 RepID=A0A6M3JSK4_9ZZZZ